LPRCSYLYVEDVAEAFDCVLHKGTTGEVYNIGTEKERTVLEVRRWHPALPQAPGVVVVGVCRAKGAEHNWCFALFDI
jgi:hypothetical protein